MACAPAGSAARPGCSGAERSVASVHPAHGAPLRPPPPVPSGCVPGVPAGGAELSLAVASCCVGQDGLLATWKWASREPGAWAGAPAHMRTRVAKQPSQMGLHACAHTYMRAHVHSRGQAQGQLHKGGPHLAHTHMRTDKLTQTHACAHTTHTASCTPLRRCLPCIGLGDKGACAHPVNLHMHRPWG